MKKSDTRYNQFKWHSLESNDHHINNVKHHPRLAGEPNNIRFVTPKEHYRLHGNGRYREKMTGKMMKR